MEKNYLLQIHIYFYFHIKKQKKKPQAISHTLGKRTNERNKKKELDASIAVNCFVIIGS